MSARYGNFELPLEFRQRPSRRVLFLVSVAHAGGIACLFFTSLPPPATWCAAIVIIAAYAFTLPQLLQRRGRFYLDMGRQWQWQGTDGTDEILHLLNGSFVHPWLVVLRFRGASGRRVALLAPDNTNPDQLRRLRVYLRLRRHSEQKQ